MDLTTDLSNRLRSAVNRQRLVDTAVQLIAVPSRTGEAGAVSDRLADILTADGFHVERPAAAHPTAPAVVVRFTSGKAGRTLQFNGHLDTVHLPFIPPNVQNGRITGSGSSDMKAGIAAAVEALRALRDTGALPGGAILLTAHDLHETPWGDGHQLDQLIADGYVGDAVLLPEYLNECLPVIGRGGLTWKVTIGRSGSPIHEVMRPAEPSVIAAGAELVARLNRLHQKVSAKSDAMAGSESVFIGQIHSGEIFNQYPQHCRLEGTRRWLPGTRKEDAIAELRALFDGLANDTGTTISAEFHLMRDAFLLPQDNPFVAAFQEAYAATSGGQPLKVGAKPFCDDGNSFWSQARVPAITHGPSAGGAHTLNEWVSIDDLVRVAHLYAVAAVAYCGGEGARMMDVTILGSGAALPAPGQTNSAYLVRAGAVRLLVDCGPAILQQLAAVGLTPGDVTHVFLTHRHGDHTLGYPLFLLWWVSRRGQPQSFPMTIAGQTTWASLKLLLENTFGEVARQAESAPRRLFADREPAVLNLDEEITLRTWPMEHSTFAPVSGLRVEAAGRVVAFTGDTAPCTNTALLGRAADLLLHESAYSAILDPDLHDGLHGHCTARSAGRAAAAAGARRLALVHLSAHYAGRQDMLIAEAAREFAGEVTAPTAGTVYVL